MGLSSIKFCSNCYVSKLVSSTGFGLPLLKTKHLCIKCCAFIIWTDVEWLILSDSDRQSSVFGQLVKHSLLLPFQTLILLPVYFFSINPSVMLVEGTDASSVPPIPIVLLSNPTDVLILSSHSVFLLCFLLPTPLLL